MYATAPARQATYRYDGPTPRQSAFIRQLIAEVFPGQSADDLIAEAGRRGGFATFEATRNSIDMLIARRDAARVISAPNAPATSNPVPAGLYALPAGDGAWDFYKVVEGTGKWAGRTFVNRFRSDFEDRLTAAEQRRTLGLIAAAGAETAGRAFAEHTQCCRRCGRMLTDIPTATKNGGWGPECVKHV